MTLDAIRDEIKLELTGFLLHMEIPDETIDKVIMKSLREISRYCDTRRLITCPFARCIDTTGFKCKSITKVYRTKGYIGENDDKEGKYGMGAYDPWTAQMWMSFTNAGTMYNLNDYVLNYLSYNTLMQMRNTTSTDLNFTWDQARNQLMINVASDKPTNITIEYIPILEKVEDVISDYWIDMLIKLSIAETKVVLGRIRNRFTTSSALWKQESDTMLQEGLNELNALREKLSTNAHFFVPLD